MDNPVHTNAASAVLAECHLFRMVDWQTIQSLAKEARLSVLHRGEMVSPCGSADRGFFLVKSGQVKLSIISLSGAERVIDVVRSGETFGETTLFSDRCTKLHAQMLKDGELLEIPRTSFNRAIGQSPHLAASMLRYLSSKLCRLLDEVENCCLRTATQRVVDYLSLLAKEQSADGAITIRLPTSKSVIASLLDLTPETFSRELKRLNTMGLIEVGRKSVRILDLQAMQRSVVKTS